MSFDVFVMSFRDGDSAAMPSAPFHAVFGPHIDHVEREFGFWHVRAPDGGEADLYATVDGETCASVMINHFSGGDVLDLLVEFARRADGVIVPVGCPVLITAADQRAHLPDDMVATLGVAAVATGDELAMMIASE